MIMDDKQKTLALFIILVLFGYWSYLLIAPFLSYIVLGLILALLIYPLYLRFSRKVGESWAALVSIITIFLLIIIPSVWLTTNLIAQAGNAYQLAVDNGVVFDGNRVAEWVYSLTGADFKEPLSALFGAGKSLVTAAIPSIISSTSTFLIGIIVLVFVMYYALKDGRQWYALISDALPIRKAYKKQLKHDMENMTKALFYGQILAALLIGIGTGTVFAAFNVPNAVFWGFIMMVLAFLPLLGAPIVYLPAGVILLLNGRWIAGISIIVLCTAVIFTIEYIVRPKFVSKTSQIHPLTVIIGALGGIYLLGFVGFLVGPLILGIFVTLLSFDYGMSD